MDIIVIVFITLLHQYVNGYQTRTERKIVSFSQDHHLTTSDNYAVWGVPNYAGAKGREGVVIVLPRTDRTVNGITKTGTHVKPHDLIQNQEFGSSTSISPDEKYLAVFSHRRMDTTYLYLFLLDGLQFIQKIQFIKELSPALKFGANNELVVGARHADDKKGVVYIYSYKNGRWTEAQRIQPDELSANSHFGVSFDINEDHLVIGARGANVVYSYEKKYGSWILQEKLQELSGKTFLYFGSSVMMDGDRLIVGGYPQTNDPSIDVVFLYEHINGTKWVKVATFRIVTPQREGGSNTYTPHNRFGWAMIRGNIIAINDAHADHHVGATYVYKYNTAQKTWDLTLKLQQGQQRHNWGRLGGAGGNTLSNNFISAKTINPTGVTYLFDISDIMNVTRPPLSLPSFKPLPQSITSGGTCAQRKAHTTCMKNSFAMSWDKSCFPGGESFQVSYLDQTCNQLWDNGTHVGTNASYTHCGTVKHQNGEHVQLHNQITLMVGMHVNTVIQRGNRYKYNVNCVFDRTVQVSSDPSFDLAPAVVNVSQSVDFNVHMNIYTSATFLNVAKSPYKVEAQQPLYVGIKEESEVFKMVVTECYATPKNKTTLLYTYFSDKCSVDPTLRILHHDNNTFRYQMDTFTFMSEQQSSIVLHCRITLCPLADQTAQCQQQCQRSRRGISADQEDDDTVKEVVLTSQTLKFTKFLKCKDISCPVHSVCVNARPAVCRCVDNYMMEDGRCTKENTFLMKGIRVLVNFDEIYLDSTSKEFQELTDELGKILLSSSMQSSVVDVKFINPRKGSVIVDAVVRHIPTVSKEEAFQQMIDVIVKDTPLRNGSTSFSIDTGAVPVLVEDGDGLDDGDAVVFPIAVVVPCVVIVAVVLFLSGCFVFVRRRRVNGEKVEIPMDGNVNAGVNNDTE